MIGVVLEEFLILKIYYLMYDIMFYNIFEGSYCFFQMVDYWFEGMIFVLVVDLGVGLKCKSVVVKIVKN